MKKYLIFDLDGTLIQSDKQITEIIYTYIVNEIDPELLDTARYLIENNQGMSMKETFNILIKDAQKAEKHYKNITRLIDSINGEVNFFPGAQEKIKELSKKYTLFLSTGNSDNFANTVLEQGGIKKYFDKILGSSYILKSHLHINEFIDFTGDEYFCSQSIFIGDGQRDKEIADFNNIDFIHIGSNLLSEYEIKSVINIDNILNIIDNKGKQL